MKETLAAVLDRDGDVSGFDDQQRLMLAKLAQQGYVTVHDDRAEANFCVFTAEQEERLEREIFAPILERLKPGVAAMAEDMRRLVARQLPPQLQGQLDHAVTQASFYMGYVTYILAAEDGRLYLPETREDGMFLTFCGTR